MTKPSEELGILSGIYEIETIVAKRKHKCQVLWLGYDASENIWVAEDEL